MNLHIEDSYKVGQRDFFDHYTPEILSVRTAADLDREWAVHNLLYRLGIAREHTRSVDLNYPLPWYERAVYRTFGGIALLLVP